MLSRGIKALEREFRSIYYTLDSCLTADMRETAVSFFVNVLVYDVRSTLSPLGKIATLRSHDTRSYLLHYKFYPFKVVSACMFMCPLDKLFNVPLNRPLLLFISSVYLYVIEYETVI